jgi:bifunctional UDP-N-acetylglucosamine pyrophosphorylase/glucosamine-1-phosphate N-acetyltransferase
VADAAVILAAGQGVRMRSSLPKVMHPLAGKPLVVHVVETAVATGLSPVVVVVGVGGELVEDALRSYDVRTVVQDEQLGTGHAVLCAAGELDTASGRVVVLAGDVPLIRSSTLRALLDEHERMSAVATVLTMFPPDPSGYGRVIRAPDGTVLRVVEEVDADESERSVREINSGTYAFDSAPLFDALPHLSADNAQGEYYLPEVIARFRLRDLTVAAVAVDDPVETAGVNSPEQLAELEREYARFAREPKG